MLIKRIPTWVENQRRPLWLLISGIAGLEKKLSIYFKLILSIFLFFLFSSSYGQPKKHTFKIYDTYQSYDSNKIEFLDTLSNDNSTLSFLEGKIVNCYNEAIVGAKVTLFKNDTLSVGGCKSDTNGKFKVFDYKGIHTLKIQGSSCQNFEVKLEFKESQIHRVRITLYRKSGTKETIYITNRKQTKKRMRMIKENNHNCKCGL